MGQILKLPTPSSKLGYKRVGKRRKFAENPDQLSLFPQATAQILNFAPESDWFEQALLWDERGDARAAELYLRAIAEGNCIADAYCNLGIIESQKGNTTKAFDCFTLSLKHDPRHSEAHFNLGNLYFDTNDLRLAQVHYEFAGEVDPAFASVFFNLALVQAINHNLTASISALTRYKELVSDDEGRNADELLRNLKRSLSAASKCPKN
jgi:tetratricopeptide (TPR) repeat protein